MRRLALTMIVGLMPVAAWAGGPPRDIVTKAECHSIRLTAPSMAVARYVELQKDRFEDPDPAVVARLGQAVLVSVGLQEGMDDISDIVRCLSAGPPQKIILVQDDKPLLTIPLVAKEYEMKNLAGASFTAYEASAEIPVTDVRELLGSDVGFGMRLVFANYVYKGHWDNDWAENLLK